MKFPVLETERLRLRPFTIEDASRVKELAESYEVSKTSLNIPHPYEEGIAEEWISTHQKQFFNSEGVRFCIELKETNEVIGSIGLVANKRHKRAVLGFWIGFHYWSSGFCTEACRKVIEYGFSELGYHKILADHFKGNPASGKVMKKSGMKYEGTFRDHYFKDGEFYSVDSYSILRANQSLKVTKLADPAAPFPTSPFRLRGTSRASQARRSPGNTALTLDKIMSSVKRLLEKLQEEKMRKEEALPDPASSSQTPVSSDGRIVR